MLLKDLCTQKVYEQISVVQYGCTSPFGHNKTQICTDQENGTNVLKMYVETIEKHNGNCFSPCSFITTRAIKTNDRVQPLFRGKRNGFIIM